MSNKTYAEAGAFASASPLRQGGLTKREYFASQALGILVGEHDVNYLRRAVRNAVQQADLLIEALNASH